MHFGKMSCVKWRWDVALCIEIKIVWSVGASVLHRFVVNASELQGFDFAQLAFCLCLLFPCSVRSWKMIDDQAQERETQNKRRPMNQLSRRDTKPVEQFRPTVACGQQGIWSMRSQSRVTRSRAT